MEADLKEAIDEKRIAHYLPSSNQAYDEVHEDGQFPSVSFLIVLTLGCYS